MKKIYKNIDGRNIIDRVMSVKKQFQQDIAIEIFDISGKNLSNRIAQGRINFYKLLEWAVHNNVDLNWLITGKKITKKSHPEDIDHAMEGNEIMDKNERIDLLLRTVASQAQTIERLIKENETLKSIAASKKPDISNAANINQSGI